MLLKEASAMKVGGYAYRVYVLCTRSGENFSGRERIKLEKVLSKTILKDVDCNEERISCILNSYHIPPHITRIMRSSG